MKTILLFLLALAVGCQLMGCSHGMTGTPQPSPFADAQRHSEMQVSGTFRRLSRLRTQEQAEVLEALAVGNRQLVSQLFGQLAVTQKPDVVAAARKLDSALTPKEKQSILRASANSRQQYTAMMGELQQKLQKMAGSEQQVFAHDITITTEDPGMTVMLLVAENLFTQASKAAHRSGSMF
jgi:hypothetical protein